MVVSAATATFTAAPFRPLASCATLHPARYVLPQLPAVRSPAPVFQQSRWVGQQERVVNI
jgi:hypothetical protein